MHGQSYLWVADGLSVDLSVAVSLHLELWKQNWLFVWTARHVN